eukprot:TRINITY_DN1532_c0_g1_i3.p1 TRINITY_DN1532_c0_g1~~TRINITY_DN1532_c0_g1_i3.p1  ORF type:complete len:405 (+),score=36.20 TRINITY_DN1532_c0_g1_i3:125-1339(+)
MSQNRKSLQVFGWLIINRRTMLQFAGRNRFIVLFLLTSFCLRQIRGQESPLETISQQAELSIANQAFNAEFLEESFSANISEPTFGGIVCVPTDDAFMQFFDEAKVSQDTFLSSPVLVNTFVGSNLIPDGGVQGGLPGTGQARVANTFIEGEQLEIFRNDEGKVSVTSPTGNIARVQTTIKEGNATIWTLDSVLQSKELVKQLILNRIRNYDLPSQYARACHQGRIKSETVFSLINLLGDLHTEDATDVIYDDPELSILASLLQCDQVSDDAAQQVFDPGFGGIICAPTDSAFLQFFDEQEVDLYDQEFNIQDLLTQIQQIESLVDMHIIPQNGIVGGVPVAGETKSASTLNKEQQLSISRSIEGQVSVKDPQGGVAAVLDTIKVKNATVWKLDSVLKPNEPQV